MKILFSLTYYTPYSSGLTLYVKRLAEALLKRGFQASVVSFLHDKSLNRIERINGVSVYRAKPILTISKGFLSIDWLMLNFKLVRYQDVVIVNLPQFEGVIPSVLAKLFHKKLIVIYHCEVKLPSGFFNKIVEKLLRVSNFMSLWCADIVLTYTEDFGRNNKLLNNFQEKLEFVYPPIVKPKIDKRVQNILRKKIGKTNYIIGVAARLAAEKGIEYLLESIPAIISKLKTKNSKPQLKSQSFKIIIAGSMEPVGEESYKMSILDLVEKYKDYVVFLGELQEEEMGSFYSLLDVLVLPSVNSTESFGMVQVEAMLMGVPVVASDLPGVRVPIQKTGMGIVVPIRDSRKISEAIVEILTNKSKYIKTKQSIKNEFSSSKTIKFYEKLLK